MKKQNKWLDNYGKVDNANESNVTLPEGFVGMGYDTKGRDYSPAWGGQFQTGGSIPGTPGFTYARTAGSAPSEGKYAKKTMPSAQYGIQSPLLMMSKVAEMMGFGKKDNETVPIEEEKKEAVYQPGLTNELLLRQAYKESTFNPKAVSPKGYKGLAQIGEDVVKDYMRKKENKKLDPFNLEDAIQLQKFAMEDLYNSSFINKPDQSDSVRIAKSLAGFNWGRGNLFDYLGEQKKKGIDIYNSYDWLKDLPKETSDYVNKILLQKDEPFNKDYQKAISNPKYKDITGLYETKEFGGDIPSAQNGEEMKFYQEGLDWKPKSMQDGGQQPLRVSTTDPRYAELYKNKQLGRWLDENTFDSQVPLDEVTVRPQSYSMESLRDFTKAAMYGVPENLMKLEQVPTAALTETVQMLRGEPYDFRNVNPNFGQFGSNQRDLSVLGYENPQGFIQNAVNMGLSAIDPAMVTGLAKNPVKNLTKTFTDNLNYSKSINPQRNIVGDELKPAFGFARGNETFVRGDLPERVKNFVQAHEDYHVYDFQKYPNSSDSFFRRELPANFFPALKDPIGFASTVKHSLTPERLSFYKKRLKENFKTGGVIKDNRGQWDHPGEITEIDSPYITMEGVPYPVIGKSNTGDTKLMLPGENYKFKGKKVTEFPLVAQRGGKVNINDLDAQPKKKLNQLLNFTNNPDKNWLDNL